MPPPESNIGVLAEAIRKIEKNPLPAHMDGPMGEFLEYAGGSASSLCARFLRICGCSVPW